MLASEACQHAARKQIEILHKRRFEFSEGQVCEWCEPGSGETAMTDDTESEVENREREPRGPAATDDAVS